jgi:hypothetical protein
MAFLSDLQAEIAKPRAARADPWSQALRGVRGVVGDDGIERVPTQRLFDLLEVRQRARTAGAARRLAKVMRDLGWTAVRVRDLTRGGYKENVRGYCREVKRLQGQIDRSSS